MGKIIWINYRIKRIKIMGKLENQLGMQTKLYFIIVVLIDEIIFFMIFYILLL